MKLFNVEIEVKDKYSTVTRNIKVDADSEWHAQRLALVSLGGLCKAKGDRLMYDTHQTKSGFKVIKVKEVEEQA